LHWLPAPQLSAVAAEQSATVQQPAAGMQVPPQFVSLEAQHADALVPSLAATQVWLASQGPTVPHLQALAGVQVSALSRSQSAAVQQATQVPLQFSWAAGQHLEAPFPSPATRHVWAASQALAVPHLQALATVQVSALVGSHT
jgi:hypothetical protein